MVYFQVYLYLKRSEYLECIRRNEMRSKKMKKNIFV